MKKQCSNCEFNFDGKCAGHGNLYKYGESITDDTKCCDDWGASPEYYIHQTATAPRFLRDLYNSCHISYAEFSKYCDDYEAGKPVPIHIFDAIKLIYGISMVDIAVLLGVTYGVVYRAKTAGFAKKRIPQFAEGLCIPEKFLLSPHITTLDFEELSEFKKVFFHRPGISETLNAMPPWKIKLAQEISSIYVYCPIHIVNAIARVDNLYWNNRFSMDGYTESEQAFIDYIQKGTKKHPPIHNLDYFLDIGCHPHMETRAITNKEISKK